MIEKTCRQEEPVREATAREELSPELRAHIAACPVCRQTADVAAGLKQLQREMLRRFPVEARLPTAGDLLERARKRPVPGSWEAREIVKPIRLYRRFVLPAGLITGLATIVLNGKAVNELLRSLPGAQIMINGFHSLPSGLNGSSFGILAALSGLGLLTLMILAAATRSKSPER